MMQPLSQCSHRSKRTCVVGKGRSLDAFHEVDADTYISCNEAIYEVRKGFFTKFDRPAFKFCEELPPGVIPIVQRTFKNDYPDGFYFNWHTLEGGRIAASGCQAIQLAGYFRAKEIILCGFDSLRSGDRTYKNTVANEANLTKGLKDQRGIFRQLPKELMEICKHYDGTPLSAMAEYKFDHVQPAIQQKLSGVLHISQFPRGPKPKRACIVGKGPSMDEWRNIPDVDVYFTVNEATYAVDRLHFHCRGDGHRPGFRAMDWLPSFAVPFIPARLRHYYGYGYYFEWEDIGSDGICLTSIQAVRLAHWMGADEIILCGLDALRNGDETYTDWVANDRNKNFGMRDQKDRFRLLPPEIAAKCRHFDGTPMVNPDL